MRFFLLILMFSSACAMTCREIQTVYNQKNCCSDASSDTCLRAIPSCNDTSVVAGQICTDSNGKAFVKGLAEALDLSDTNSLILKKTLDSRR